MNIKIVTILIVLLLSQNNIIAQNNPNQQDNLEPTPVLEKVYLHTDRSLYNIGESLWYKAYLTNAENNVLLKQSNVLYVELVSSKSKIIARNKTFINNGLGNGDFVLNDSIGISEGTYQLRAYTNYMRNFGDDFIFKKEIEIIDINQKKEIESDTKIAKKQKIALNDSEQLTNPENNLQVTFFPEGGSIINNIPCIIAFKANDRYGNPINVNGKILDNKNNTIASIKSEHNGMGKFIFTPLDGIQYKAEIINLNGVSTKFELPKSINTGYTLNITANPYRKIATINTNLETLKNQPSKLFKIEISTRGKIYFEGSIDITKSKTSFLIPSNILPEGIAQVTIIDENNLPFSERLVYIEKESTNNIVIEKNKNQYQPKEKVNLKIIAKNKLNEPITASFSLAITDVNNIDNKLNYGLNICSYFLLDSDIKGKVYNPSYYFDNSNPNRLLHLDLLLLTQGWRDFLWKKNPTMNPYSNKFNVEKGFSIGGKVKKLFSSSVKENNLVSLYFLNQGKSNIKIETTDSLGRFEFKNLYFIGNTGLRINVKDKKNRRKGMIILDSLKNRPMFTNYSGSKKASALAISDIETIKNNIFKKHIEFNVPLDNRLDEILIVSKKKLPTTASNNFEMANYTYVASEDSPKFSNMADLIQFSIPGTSIVSDTLSFNRANGAPALLMLNDIEIEMTDLTAIPPSSVAIVEGVTPGNAVSMGPRGVNGVIFIYIKEGVDISVEEKLFHTISTYTDGFYNSRTFYSPNYEEEKDSDITNEPDIRNTLYWNPYIHPDTNGEVEINYFNSEVKTNVNIVLEGISDSGIPMVVKSNYLISK